MPRRLGRLYQRKDFLRIAAGRRKSVAPGLILQALPALETALAGAHAEGRRVGFTASKKVGNAVARNRAKRRLRAAVSQVMAEHAASAHDYVVIARQETVDRAYRSLVQELETALKRLGVWRDGT
jgi:ribonuclease P protein component